MEQRKQYPLLAEQYRVLEEVGQGVSAIVYRALCLPFNEIVAIKRLDLERCNSNLDDIRKEAQIMSLIDHPNVVRSYCSFVVEQCLWVVMPYMDGGSCLHIMKAAFPDGFEEQIIAIFLKETLKALDYLHRQGHIHRDVKAGNILVDRNGVVKLADFGVSACMFDTGDRVRSRSTFVGTPCWMAPEVMEQINGYNFKADIWSFGITALELAHGHAPFSKYPPMKVLLMTLQNAPPGLDYERDKRFSKSFKEMTAVCLMKDPTKRPTAEKLLKHSFFKRTKSSDFILRNVLEGLPPLWERVRSIKLKDDARLAQHESPYIEQEQKSQNEYKRGVSAWKFDMDDLKAEAALIQSDEEIHDNELEAAAIQSSCSSPELLPQSDADSIDGQSSTLKSVGGSPPEKLGNEKRENGKECVGIDWKYKRRSSSGSLIPELVVSQYKGREEPHASLRGHSGPLISDCRRAVASLRKSPTANPDNLKAHIQRGRFSVTQSRAMGMEASYTYPNQRKIEEMQTSALHKSASVGDWSVQYRQPHALLSSLSPKVSAAVLVPHLQDLLSQVALQQDTIMTLMSNMTSADHKTRNGNVLLKNLTSSAIENMSERECELRQQVIELQGRVMALTDEIEKTKLRNVQLQRELAAFSRKDVDESA